jgi:hypothetical protein
VLEHSADERNGTEGMTLLHPCSELERLANIRRNQELLKDLDLVGHSKALAPRSSGGSATKSKKTPRQATKKVEPQRVQPRRSSNRLAGVEADSETLKRKYEVGRQEQKGSSCAAAAAAAATWP